MANFLNKLFNPILKKTNDSVLGIDIGSSSVKIVQLRNKKGKAVLETYGELALGPYAKLEVGRATKLTISKLVEAINTLIKESKVTTIESAISIPMRSSMIAIVKMPDIDRKQQSQLIPIEAKKYIPAPINEVTLNWYEIPKDDEQKVVGSGNNAFQQEFLVIAIHNDTLNNYSSIVNEANLNTNFFEVEMFATIRSILDPNIIEPVIIIDVGAGETKSYIIEKGIVRDSHTIAKGSQDVTLQIANTLNVTVEFAEKLKRNFGNNSADKDKLIDDVVSNIMDPIFDEINNVIQKYKRDNNDDISRVFLIGGGVMLSGLDQKAKKKFLVDVVYGDPFSKIETPEFLRKNLRKTGLAFGSAIGLCLRQLQEKE